MKIVRHLLLFLFLAAFSRGEDGPQNVAELFQTSENLEIVTSPEWVDLCILYPKKPWFSRKHPTKYREGKYIKLSPADAAVLSGKLTDNNTYGWDILKMCMPTYNARVRFHRGSHTVTADFCFGCDILALRKDGEIFSGEDFDGASTEIFEVVRSRFPKNTVVRAVENEIREDQKNRAQIEEATRLDKEKKAKHQANSPQNSSDGP
jgi:hypothetical protein